MPITGALRQATAPLVLAASLAVTAWLWQHEHEVVARHQAAQMDSDLRELAGRIEQRMAAYAQVVAGVQGLYVAQATQPTPAAAATAGTGAAPKPEPEPGPHGEIDRALLRAYFESLQLGADFAGLNGAGIAAGAGPVRVLQMEPAVAASRPWLGADLGAARQTREAMEAARQSGRVTLSGPLPPQFAAPGASAAAASGGQGSARLALLAAVKGSGEAQRPPGWRTWVVAPLSVGDMMASLYGEAIPGVEIRIYDGVGGNPQSLLYDATASIQAPFRDLAGPAEGSADGSAEGPAKKWAEAVEYVVVAGRTWTLEVRSRASRAERAFGAGNDRSSIIALAGTGLSFALALLTWSLATGRARALAIALQMTRELQASETRFRHLAQYDELTRLPNRALFNDRLQQALAQARRERSRLALMFIDLDGFKPVNDRLGHAVGDMVLVAVARRMLRNVRESDTVARIGGDEFVVLLPAVREERDAIGVAEKIRHALNEPFHLDGGHLVTISSSTGVAFYPEHGEDGRQLSASADHAMYHAKHSGRDRVCVYQNPARPWRRELPDETA